MCLPESTSAVNMARFGIKYVNIRAIQSRYSRKITSPINGSLLTS